MVSVKPDDPAPAETGDVPEMLGNGFVTLNVSEVEAPPPGVGFTTVTKAEPAAATSALPIAAVNSVALR